MCKDVWMKPFEVLWVICKGLPRRVATSAPGHGGQPVGFCVSTSYSNKTAFQPEKYHK